MFDCHEGTDYKAKNYYFSRSMRTLFIDEPMVIYCDPHYVSKFMGIRMSLGYYQTKVIPMTVKDLYLYKYKHLTKQRNERLTAEMAIVWCSKPELLLSVVQSNPFQTSHVSWIDINHLSKHHNDSLNYFRPDIYERIHAIATHPHDKFAIMTLNGWSSWNYNNLDTYYSSYPIIVSGGFFTMDLDSGLFILPKVIELAEKHAAQGHLWSDEPLYAIIIDQYEEHFTLLLGDYQDTIHNYFNLETTFHYIFDIIINNYRGHGKQERLRKILKDYEARDTVKLFNYAEAHALF
jgi:hypothetical protein